MLPVGDASVASTRYRVLAYREALGRGGLAPVIRFVSSSRRLGRRGGRVLDLIRDTWRSPRADVVFIQRRTYPGVFARRLARFRMPVVFDLDDAIFLPPPGRPGTARDRARYRRNFDATLAAADVVVCGSNALASTVEHPRVEVLPTPVDTVRFRPLSTSPVSRPTLGWVGYSDNLRYLERLAEPFHELVRRHPELRIVVVADRPPELPGLPVEFRRWRLENEVECFRGITVGMMPLDDDPWTRAKCSYKLLQYMALGLPSVASPVGMNIEVIEHGGNGFLAGNTEEWVLHIDRLLSNTEEARRIAHAARLTVEKKFSLEVTAPRLIAILRSLL